MLALTAFQIWICSRAWSFYTDTCYRERRAEDWDHDNLIHSDGGYKVRLSRMREEERESSEEERENIKIY